MLPCGCWSLHLAGRVPDVGWALHLVQEHVPHSLHGGNAHQMAPECISKRAPSPAIAFSQLSQPSLPESTICLTDQLWDRLHCRQHMLKAAWKSQALTQSAWKTSPWHISTLGLSARAEHQWTHCLQLPQHRCSNDNWLRGNLNPQHISPGGATGKIHS